MRYLLIITLALSLIGVAEAQAQRDTLKPRLSISPKRVQAGERFTLTARGFSPSATVTVLFAISGQAPYGSYAPPTGTLADGSYSLPFVFETCGNSPDALTITLVDAFGVQDSAPLVLC